MRHYIRIPLIIFISFFFIANTGTINTFASRECRWISRNQFYFCSCNGKLYKNGIYKINDKKYYFDKDGRQRTGWRKVNKEYYFFRDQNAEKGYMLKNCTVDGISINRYGRALLSTDRAKAKMPIMIRILGITDSLVRPGMKSSQKLKICFEYARKHFWEANIRDLGHKKGNWDITYAKHMLDCRYGNCYCYASVFAYMANALGFQDVLVVNNDDHCWTEINGKIYDVEWANAIGVDKCYAVPPSLSGKNRRQNWAKWRPYIRDVNK